MLVGITERVMKIWSNMQQIDLRLDWEESIKYGKLKKKLGLAKQTYMRKEEFSEQMPISYKCWQDIYSEYRAEAPQFLYQKYSRDEQLEQYLLLKDDREGLSNLPVSILRTKDRLRIVYEAMIQDSNIEHVYDAGKRKVTGAEIPIGMLIENLDHPLRSFFPLHQEAYLKWFENHWLKPWSLQRAFWVPVERIREYFGEPVGFYFAFLRHYCFWLTGPAFVGGCMFVAQI